MIFRIACYQGVNGVLFGATQEEVAVHWGKPDRHRTTTLGERSESRGEMRCVYNSGRLVEIGFGPSCIVTIQDVADVLHNFSALNNLLVLDPSPYEAYGFLVFFELGITLTGVHDGDDSQLAATAFSHGRWSKSESGMTPWHRNVPNQK